MTNNKQLIQRLEDEEARLRAILETAVDAIITIDDKGIVQSFNKAAEKIFGYSSSEMIGKNINILMPETDHSRHGGYLREYQRTGVKKIIGIGREVVGLRKSGTTFPCDLSVSQVDIAGRILYAGIVRDITQRKATEKALRESNRALEEATRLKSEFLTNMSHELRAPMNAIIGFTKRVIKKSGMLLPEKQLKNLNIVEKNAHHLLTLINSLLDLSKIEAGKIEVFPESFSLSSLISELVDLARSLTSEKDIQVTTDLPEMDVTLITDKTKLKQILMNLIGNAIKFTDKGEITIIGRLLREKGLEKQASDSIVLDIIDTGIGMTQDEQKYIFDAFCQIDGTTTRKTGGTGLGLTIAKRFTDLLQGKLEVESVQGAGTKFTLTIPSRIRGIDTTEDGPKRTFTEAQKERTTILCIDDDSDVIELLRGYLEDEGFNVVSALNGDEGIRKAKFLKPLAITLDIYMPDKDGWTVLTELKKDPETKNIPVIIASIMDNRQLGYSLGAIEYLQKPVVPEELIDSIERVLYRKTKTVLVVDDDPEIQDRMREILEEDQFRVKTAKDGLEALGSLGEQLPDLIILDLAMPGMDGFEMVNRLKEKKKWVEIPIIAVTAEPMTTKEYRFLNRSVASVMEKGGMTTDSALKEITTIIKRLKIKDG